jgi:hypothetical protein
MATMDLVPHVPSAICSCDGEGAHCPAHVVAWEWMMRGRSEQFERYVRLVTRWRAAS